MFGEISSDGNEPDQQSYVSLKQVGEPLATRAGKTNSKKVSKRNWEKKQGDMTNDHDSKYYPTYVRSFYEFLCDNVPSNPSMELAAAFVGEVLSIWWLWFPIGIVAGFVRTDAGVIPPFVFSIPIVLTAFVASSVVHFMWRRISCDANPCISFFRGFLPDTTEYPVKYHGVKANAKNPDWLMDSWKLTAVKLIAQFGASLLVVLSTTYLEPKGTLGFPGASTKYDGAAFPFIVADASGSYVRSGTLLFLGALTQGVIQLSMQLEFVKIKGVVLQSLYTGMGTGLAFLMSYYATSTPLNIFIPLCKMMIHRKSSDQPLTVIFVPVILGYGLAAAIFFWITRVTSQNKEQRVKKPAQD